MTGKKKIGIVGGMGPMATVYLFQKIVENTESPDDQGHIRIFIDNCPQIPDRTKAISRGDHTPAQMILSCAKGLAGQGADMILMPCNTAHYFYEEVQKDLSVELVNMIDETARSLAEQKVHTAGLMATTGTVNANLYQKYCEKRGIGILLPDKEEQDAVMDFIYSGVKASNWTYDVKALRRAAEHLLERGASTLILGCTEIPVGFHMFGLDLPGVDTLEVLARAAVVKAGYRLNGSCLS